MKQPELDPLDADLADLLAAERGRPGPAPDAHARVLAKVSATVGTSGGAGNGGAPPAPPPAGGALLVKPIVVGLALGVALVAGVVRYGGDAPGAAARPAPAMVEPAASAIVQSAPSTVASPPASSSARRPSAPVRHGDTLGAEREILDEANRALTGGRTADAFAALERHAGEFPNGRLSEERDGLWLRALIAAGRLDEARARAARFKRLHPRSMLLPALESTLGTIP